MKYKAEELKQHARSIKSYIIAIKGHLDFLGPELELCYLRECDMEAIELSDFLEVLIDDYLKKEGEVT